MSTDLREGENHPCAQDAFGYIKSVPTLKLIEYQEAFASCGLSGNRMAEVCSGTLTRILRGDSVGERYVFGLAWAIRDMEEKGE